MAWNRVRWTEAGQVAALLGRKHKAVGVELGQPPEVYYRALRDAGRLNEAVEFLAQALPRYESVAWAARTARDYPPPEGHEPSDGAALKATLLWVQDPTDNRRRAAFDAANGVGSDSGAGMVVAYAAYLSGGSLAPEGLEPVLPPPECAGQLAGAAILLATANMLEREEALAKALAAGEKIASEGLSIP